MKKIFALIAALAFAMLALAGPASAGNGGDRPGADNKKVTICHYKGDNGANKGKYAKVEVSVNGWYNGHKADSRDIWRAFSYTDKRGNTVTVPQQGDVGRLDFDNCKRPDDDEKIAKPEPTKVDVCGTENDVDLAVAPGRGYEVGTLVKDGNKQTIVVTLLDGFVWSNGSSDPLTFTHTFSAETPEECDLPETGGEATYNTVLGGAALAGVVILGGVMLLTRRKRV